MPFKGIPFYIMNKSAAAEGVVTTGLQLYHDFGISTPSGAQGTIADLSGNNRSSTFNGTQFTHVSGTAGYVYDFANFDTILKPSAVWTLNTINELTVQAVFMYEASQYEGAKLFASSNQPTNVNWALETRFGGSEIYFISDNGSRSAGTTVTQNVWNFASAVRSVANLSVSLRTNGNSRITNTYASLGSVNASNQWMVSRSVTGGVVLRGRLAAVLFYNRALSTTEETQNYNYFKTRYTSIP